MHDSSICEFTAVSEGYVRVRRKIADFTHHNRYSVREPVIEGGPA